MLRQPAYDFVKRDPGGGAASIRVQEQDRLTLADTMAVHRHPASLDGFACSRLSQAVRRDEGHFFLPVEVRSRRQVVRAVDALRRIILGGLSLRYRRVGGQTGIAALARAGER